MAIRTYEILLDSYNSTIPEPIVGRQGDKNGAITLHVTITDRGTAVDLTGQTINLMAETAKGTAVVADNLGVTLTDAVNGKFDYAIPNALWSEAGKITRAYFSLNDTNGQQTTYDLIFIVKESVDISQGKANDYITIIDGTLRDLQTKIDAIYKEYQNGSFYSRNEIDDFLKSYVKYSDIADTTAQQNGTINNGIDLNTLNSGGVYKFASDSFSFMNAPDTLTGKPRRGTIVVWKNGETIFQEIYTDHNERLFRNTTDSSGTYSSWSKTIYASEDTSTNFDEYKGYLDNQIAQLRDLFNTNTPTFDPDFTANGITTTNCSVTFGGYRRASFNGYVISELKISIKLKSFSLPANAVLFTLPYKITNTAYNFWDSQNHLAVGWQADGKTLQYFKHTDESDSYDIHWVSIQ